MPYFVHVPEAQSSSCPQTFDVGQVGAQNGVAHAPFTHLAVAQSEFAPQPWPSGQSGAMAAHAGAAHSSFVQTPEAHVLGARQGVPVVHKGAQAGAHCPTFMTLNGL